VNFEIDFIELLAELVAYVLEQGAADGLFEEKPNAEGLFDSGLLSTYDMTAATFEDLFESDDHTLSARVKLPIPFDLIQYVPALKSAAEALQKIKGT
jgi:hypothetical protein